MSTEYLIHQKVNNGIMELHKSFKFKDGSDELVKIQEEETFKLLEKAINKTLGIDENEYYVLFLEDKKTSMPLSFLMRDDERNVIFINHDLWIKYLNAKSPKTKRKWYLEVATRLAHQLMHLYQELHYSKDRLESYHNKLDDSIKKYNYWEDIFDKEYLNLPIEIEATAFENLILWVLEDKTVPLPIPEGMSWRKYGDVFRQMFPLFFKKAYDSFQETFQTNLN